MGCALLPAQDAGLEHPAPIRLWKGAAPDSDAQHWSRPDYHKEWERPGQALKGVCASRLDLFRNWLAVRGLDKTTASRTASR